MLQENYRLNSIILISKLFSEFFVADSENLQNEAIICNSLMLLEQIPILHSNLLSTQLKSFCSPVATPDCMWITMGISFIWLQNRKLALKPHQYVWVVIRIKLYAVSSGDDGNGYGY